MEVDFRFPQKATCKIFNFLETSTLLRMRELCKSTMEIVDNLLIINQTQLEQFLIYETIEQDEITILFSFKNIRHLLFGKLFAISASTKIPTMFFSLTIDNQSIRIVLRSAYFKIYLVQYCSLLHARLLSFVNLSSDIIQTCSVYFDGALYDCCQLEPNPIVSNVEQWADFVHLLRPNYVSVAALPRTRLTEFLEKKSELISASFNFLLELADCTQEILNRKCDTLLIDHIQKMDTALSVSDVEKLFQFVHHLEKRKTVIMWIPYEKKKLAIGEFGMKRIRRIDRKSEFMLFNLSEGRVFA